ncbi:hypothetical protein HK104_008292 [Borealophlyctis nickersoniae]|nr:hypothetical protein HK104_008292 [Borealophlyctis nickersoniae]
MSAHPHVDPVYPSQPAPFTATPANPPSPYTHHAGPPPSYQHHSASPSTLTMPDATCFLISPDNTTSPLGQGPLNLATRPGYYGASSVGTFGIGEWELHIPLRTAQAGVFQGQGGTRVYEVRIPPTARLTRRAGPAYVLPTEAGRLRVEVNASCPFEILKAFETAIGAGQEKPVDDNVFADHKNELALVTAEGEVVGVVAENLELQGATEATAADPVVVELDTVKPAEPGASHIVMTVPPSQSALPGAAGDQKVKITAHSLNQKTSTIITTADYVSTGIITSASAIGSAVKYGAESLKKVIPPNQTPTPVSPGLMKNLERAHRASTKTAAVTKKTAETLVDAAVATGKSVARAGSKIVPSSSDPNKSKGTASAGWGLLLATAKAVSTIVDATVDGAKVVARDTAHAATDLARHRFGDHVGDALAHSMGFVGNIGLVYVDARGLTHRAFIKKAAKEAVLNVRMKDGRVATLSGKEFEAMQAAGYGGNVVGGGSQVGGLSYGPPGSHGSTGGKGNVGVIAAAVETKHNPAVGGRLDATMSKYH